MTVASDAHDWSVSPDGTRWAWRTQFNTTTGGGTLQTAPYPAGASPVTVMTDALQYAYPTAGSPALVVVGTGRQLVGIANPATAPTTVAAVDTGVLGFVALGAQGHVTYVKTIAGTAAEPLVNLFVRPWDAATPVCTLTATANALLSIFFFSADAGAGLWVRTPTYDGVLTRFSDCSSVAAVPDIYGMGDRRRSGHRVHRRRQLVALPRPWAPTTPSSTAADGAHHRQRGQLCPGPGKPAAALHVHGRRPQHLQGKRRRLPEDLLALERIADHRQRWLTPCRDSPRLPAV